MNKFFAKGCDTFRENIVACGFSVYENHFAKEGNLCNWYAVRKTQLSAPECECNNGKKVQLVVSPHHYAFREGLFGVEVDLTGEAGGIWYSLQAYGLKPENFIDKLPAVEESLVSAWNALSRETE